MKKRILSILLCLCMVACMLPTVAFAADTGKAIRLVNTNNPTGGILGYKNNNNSYDYIYMGSYNSSPVKWRVLDDQTNTGATGLFLLSEDLLGSGGHGDVYFDGTSPYSNAWQGSDAQGWCNTFESSNLDSRELAAILSTTKSDEAFTSSTHNASFAASTNILNSDQVFFLSAQEAENGQYGFTDEAARVANYGAYASVWWLRSPFAKFTSSAGAVNGLGEVYDCGVGNVWAARPAFNLNLNSVLFASAAVGGKPDGGLTAVPEYSGNEWKLTLLDNSNNFAVTEKAISAAPDDTVVLHYTGASAWPNEYISAIIADSNGAQYYGRITRPDVGNGTVDIKIPSDLAPGSYTLKVFSEQYNGDYKTDYASNFTDIALTVEKQVEEQFSLTPGGRYYFDLSAMNIPGTANSGNSDGAVSLPDTSLHYVPFTYAGTVNAYKLTTEMATTEEYAQKNKYPHSLFVADYAVTNDVSWDALNTADLIFGKNYASGGVDYTLRAPSVGSNATGSGASQRIVPQSNEWDTMLNKDSGYIQNWNKMYSWGQDTHSISAPYRAIRGYDSARYWISCNAAGSFPYVGFRPVLEVLNPDTLGSDGMKVVTLDLNGGKLGGSSEYIQIIVKSGESFTAPASDGLTRPDGDTGSYFMWLGSNSKLYAPGDNVPADVTKLTAQFALSEQFFLTPGGRYYFDLSAMNIPGTANGGNSDGAVSLPDTSLHYVPFTYVGTIEAYKLTSEMATTEEYAQQNKYPHSLFVADYAVTHTISWGGLNDEGLIFGKNYASGGVDYTLRAPSVGSNSTGSGESQHDTPSNNEWDRILDKNSGYIQNWNKMYSWGQDTSSAAESFRAYRGYNSARFWYYTSSSFRNVYLGFRPVLEVLNPGTLGSDGLKVVTLDLGGGKLGNSSEDIQIIVKTGSEFTAPASDGLTRPDGDAGSFFMWLGSNGKFYAPGDSVPAEVTKLTAQWTAPTYAVTLNTNGGTINSGNVTSYTYGVGATLPTAGDMTYTGHTFVGWYDNENLTGSPVTAIGGTETGNKEYWAKWEINQYTITFDANGGSEIAPITQDYGTKITTPADPTRKGYTFKGWDKEIPETMPAENITITARWRDTEKPTGEIIIGTNKWNKFLNELTFGIFFKDTQEVTINAVDNSGTVFVSYLVTDKDLSEAELDSLVFRAYEEPFCIDPNGEYIVYVMLVDENINITYLRSDRLTLDNIHPVIGGIENGKTYCEAQTVTVDEKYVDTVTVNGKAATLDANGGFVLPPTNGEQKIVVTDKAGNNAEMTVTVNNGHTFGEWVSDNDGTHTRKCTVDGCNAFETENCSGGNATCTQKAVCDVCGKAYGELDKTNHEGGVQEWTTRTAFVHEQKWNCCGAVIVTSEVHEWKDGVCRECGYVCLHNDADKNHICDYCKKTISTYENAATEEIKNADTVTAKLPDDSKSPQTGDNSSIILWIALLIISGGVLTGVTVFDKRKRHSVK